MSRKSSPFSASRAKSKALDAPFDAALLKRAAGIARRYRLVLEPDETLGYVGCAVELPTVFADGKSPDECVRATYHALTVAVAVMLEEGKTPPVAAAEGRRDVQVNVRLTPQEKLLLQDVAKRMGFKGLADFVRMVALERVHAA